MVARVDADLEPLAAAVRRKGVRLIDANERERTAVVRHAAGTAVATAVRIIRVVRRGDVITSAIGSAPAARAEISEGYRT